MTSTSLDRVLADLRAADKAVPFDGAPATKPVWYAVWVDPPGAGEIAAATRTDLPAGIVFVSRCVEQPLSRHLAHGDIGSLTVMKALAAIFRRDWRLHTSRHGESLDPPGRQRLRDWMCAHLTVTCTPARTDVGFGEVLRDLDPPLRVQGADGWRPEPTPLRALVRRERAVLRTDARQEDERLR